MQDEFKMETVFFVDSCLLFVLLVFFCLKTGFTE